MWNTNKKILFNMPSKYLKPTVWAYLVGARSAVIFK